MGAVFTLRGEGFARGIMELSVGFCRLAFGFETFGALGSQFLAEFMEQYQLRIADLAAT